MRQPDSPEQVRAFLDDIHMKLWGRSLESLNPDTLATVTQTCADAAALSDGGVLGNWERVDGIVEEGAAAAGPYFDEELQAKAAVLLRAVLRREMRLRGLTPPDGGTLDHALRLAAVRGHTPDGRYRARAIGALR